MFGVAVLLVAFLRCDDFHGEAPGRTHVEVGGSFASLGGRWNEGE